MEILLRTKSIIVIFILLLCYSQNIYSHNESYDTLVIRYEDYSASGYAPILRNIVYNLQQDKFIAFHNGERMNDDIPTSIRAKDVYRFIKHIKDNSQKDNSLSFSKSDINNCMSLIQNKQYLDIPPLLEIYGISKSNLIDSLPCLRSITNDKLNEFLNQFRQDNHRPLFCITLKGRNKANLEIRPCSIFKGDYWCFGENNYVDDGIVSHFLKKSKLQFLLFQLEKEYMMIGIICIHNRQK